jgi:Ca2+-binding RTX toxin-like protein
MDGGGGVDTLSGAGGSDVFVIGSNGHHNSPTDHVLDFEVGVDLLVIDIASFGVNIVQLGLASSGTVTAASFVSGAGAQPLDPNDYFIYDTASGKLQFDPDGSGPITAVELVQCTGAPLLKPSDIYIVI